MITCSWSTFLCYCKKTPYLWFIMKKQTLWTSQTCHNRHRVKYGLDQWAFGRLDYFLDYFSDHLLDYFVNLLFYQKVIFRVVFYSSIGLRRVEMVLWKWPQNNDRNNISPQFETTVSKCNNEYIIPVFFFKKNNGQNSPTCF